MDFNGLDWDDGNREKCQKHGLTIAAVESVFDGVVVILPDKENAGGEQRFRGIGTTVGGPEGIRRIHVADAGRGDAIAPGQCASYA